MAHFIDAATSRVVAEVLVDNLLTERRDGFAAQPAAARSGGSDARPSARDDRAEADGDRSGVGSHSPTRRSSPGAKACRASLADPSTETMSVERGTR